MSAESAAALHRSLRGHRCGVAVIGLLALAAGVLALVVGQGWLGDNRAHRSVIDPVAVNWLRANATLARSVAIAVGVVLLVVGLVWLVRALRVERRPDVAVPDPPGSAEPELDSADVSVTAAAVGNAIADDAARVPGVSRVRVRTVGRPDRPALRITLDLAEGSDLRRVWQQLDTTVLRRAREALGVDRLPAAVRVELAAAPRQRVR